MTGQSRQYRMVSIANLPDDKKAWEDADKKVLWRNHLGKLNDALGGASSSKDEAGGVLKNSLLSNLIRDVAGEE